MANDNIENFNEHRLLKEIDKLSKDEDIIKFAHWVNKYVTKEFCVEPEQK
jgi:hypothetical protein